MDNDLRIIISGGGIGVTSFQPFRLPMRSRLNAQTQRYFRGCVRTHGNATGAKLQDMKSKVYQYAVSTASIC